MLPSCFGSDRSDEQYKKRVIWGISPLAAQTSKNEEFNSLSLSLSRGERACERKAAFKKPFQRGKRIESEYG
jgi:hypothetical protein